MFYASFKKECLLLFRDVHALAVLFLMPLVFVVIMSLAIPTAKESVGGRIHGLLSADMSSEFNQGLSQALQKSHLSLEAIGAIDEKTVDSFFNNKKNISFLIMLPEVKEMQIDKGTETRIWLSPELTLPQVNMLRGTLHQILSRQRLVHQFAAMGADVDDLNRQLDEALEKDRVSIHYLQSNLQNVPSAVQQSVPAWLVFGMFFILIPLSATVVIEKQQGTLLRLRSMKVSPLAYFTGRLLPFFMINQLQLLLMLVFGFYIVPLLGGEALVVAGKVYDLLWVSFACSVAALGFGLLIAMLAKSTEQATAMGGGANIILAAIGGIMIPKYLMPELMQNLANLSPMSWALDAFLEVILYGHGLIELTNSLAILLGFGVLSFLLAAVLFTRGQTEK